MLAQEIDLVHQTVLPRERVEFGNKTRCTMQLTNQYIMHPTYHMITHSYHMTDVYYP